MKARIGSEIIKKKKKKKVEKSRMWKHVEYLVIGCKVIITFIIILKMCRKEGVQWEDTICANDNSWYIYD